MAESGSSGVKSPERGIQRIGPGSVEQRWYSHSGSHQIRNWEV